MSIEVKFSPGSLTELKKGYLNWTSKVKVGGDNLLALPTVILIPTARPGPRQVVDNIVFKALGANRALRESVENAYNLGFRKPAPGREGQKNIRAFALNEKRKVSPVATHLKEPLTSDTDLMLEVTVLYRESGESASESAAAQLEVKFSCLLRFEWEEQHVTSDKPFHGWLAIDFGTSTSTATIWDFSRPVAQALLQKEQEAYLRQRLRRWLTLPAAEAVPRADPADWDSFIADVTEKSVIELLSNGHSVTADKGTWQDGIRHVELALKNRESRAFRREVSNQLARIYEESFGVPPLEGRGIYPVLLESSSEVISSELEILDPGPPLRVAMGEKARQDRQQHIGGDSKWSNGTAKNLFHPSPKHYLGDHHHIQLSTGDGEHVVGTDDIIQAAFDHLIGRARAHLSPRVSGGNGGRFTKVVATYPTVSTPAVRADLERMLRALHVEEVSTSYDEATAAAIFYLWHEFSCNPDMSFETFKTGARPDSDRWTKGILFIDIGGGTTDLAYIEVEMREENPFAPGEDRGAGGRYYVLTPKIRHSSGRLQLGGELLTLRLFELLKVSLADYLLRKVSEGAIISEDLAQKVGNLELGFRDMKRDGSYKAGSLLRSVLLHLSEDHPRNSSKEYETALDNANKVLPTRWEQSATPDLCLQLFGNLWDEADKMKIAFGAYKPGGERTPEPYTVGPDELEKILSPLPYQIKYKDSLAAPFEIPYEHFLRAMGPLVRKMVTLGTGVLKAGVPSEAGAVAGAPGREGGGDEHSSVDWIILSGQTCKMELVGQEVQALRSKEEPLRNLEKVTFLPKYAKTSTSIGAMLIKYFEALGLSPEAAKPTLRNGQNWVHIDVQNLFYYLPCSFYRRTPSLREFIIRANVELYRLDEELIGKARSCWVGLQPESTIYRKDNNGEEHYWGHYTAAELLRGLDTGNRPFGGTDFNVQFEVNSGLRFKLYISHGEPHHRIRKGVASFSLDEGLKRPAGRGAAARPTAGLFADSKLACDVAFFRHGGGAAAGPPLLLFRAGEALGRLFWLEDGGGVLRGSYVQLVAPRAAETYTVAVRFSPDSEWVTLGRVSKPRDGSSYRFAYFVSLDELGVLRLHEGALPYRITQDAKELREPNGFVIERELEVPDRKPDPHLDPFSGEH